MKSNQLIIPYRQQQDIWDIAEQVRKAAWDGSVPVDVELIAERHFKLLFVPVPNLVSSVSSEAYLTGNLKELNYEPRAAPVRLRFSVAHELGHLILHPKEIKALRTGSIAEWKKTILELPEGSVWGRAEYQAREFGGRLLVPRDRLITEVQKYQVQIQKAILINEFIEDEMLFGFIAPHICRIFDVSDQVIVARLKAELIDIKNL